MKCILLSDYRSFEKSLTDRSKLGSEFCKVFNIDDDRLKNESSFSKAQNLILTHYVQYPQELYDTSGYIRSDDIAR